MGERLRFPASKEQSMVHPRSQPLLSQSHHSLDKSRAQTFPGIEVMEKEIVSHSQMAVAESRTEIPAQQHELPAEKRGTDSDVRDMYRMGKMQEMRRNFRFLSIFGFRFVESKGRR